MTLAEANARAKKTLKYMLHLRSPLIFIVQATDVSLRQTCKKCGTSFSQNGFSLKIICFKFEIEVDIVFDGRKDLILRVELDFTDLNNILSLSLLCVLCNNESTIIL